MQPQIDIQDYTDKSIVLRSNPADFFKNYSGHLTPLMGKYIPSLDYPVKGGATKVPGWIFPKKNEPQVRQMLQMIISGQVPQAAPSYQQPSQSPSFGQTLAPTGSFGQPTSIAPSASFLAAAAATASPQAPSLLTRTTPTPQRGTPSGLPVLIAPSTRDFLSPIMGLPGGAPPGYQQMVCTVLRPTSGMSLQLNVAGQKIPLTVGSATAEDGIVNRAVVTLPDGQRTMIQLNMSGLPRWEVPGFPQDHTITM